MIDMNLGTPIVAAIQSRLKTNLNTYVDAVNADNTSKGIGVQIDHVDTGMIFDYPPLIAYLGAFPAIGIQDGEITFNADTGWDAEVHSGFTIIAFDQDSDQHALAWKLRAWHRAVASCVLEGRTLPPEGWGVTLRHISPGPTLGRGEGPRSFMSFVAVSINVRSQQ